MSNKSRNLVLHSIKPHTICPTNEGLTIISAAARWRGDHVIGAVTLFFMEMNIINYDMFTFLKYSSQTLLAKLKQV